MKKLILALLILAGTVHAQSLIVISGGKTVSSGCTAPTLTSLWLPNASAGSSGHPGMNDSVGSNNGTASSGYPAYNATGGPGSTPDLTFTSASSQSLTLGTAIPTNWTTYSGFVVFNATTTGNQDLLGNAGSGFEWNLNGSPWMNVTMNGGGASISDSTSYSTSTWYTESWDWNTSTGVWHFWRYSGGTPTQIATGTTTASLGSNGFAYIGVYASAYNFFNGSIAAMGIYNGSINTTTLGTYTHCRGWN